jgi:hypothetical protein
MIKKNNIKPLIVSFLVIFIVVTLLSFRKDDILGSIIFGFVFGVVFTFLFALQGWASNKSIDDLIKKYLKNKSFTEQQFEIHSKNLIVGNILDYEVEIQLNGNENGGITFSLIIEMSSKPYYNNHQNLKNALRKKTFVQEGTKVIIPNLGIGVFTYGEFDKVVGKIELLLNRIENKTSYNTK